MREAIDVFYLELWERWSLAIGASSAAEGTRIESARRCCVCSDFSAADSIVYRCAFCLRALHDACDRFIVEGKTVQSVRALGGVPQAKVPHVFNNPSAVCCLCSAVMHLQQEEHGTGLEE